MNATNPTDYMDFGADAEAEGIATSTWAFPRLRIGSDQEIARYVLDELAATLGEIVIDEGAVWSWNATHWAAVEERDLRAKISAWDGALTPGKKGTTIKIGANKATSILSCILLQVPEYQRHGFFAAAARGINCASGFVRIDDTGTATVEPHSPDHRARHCLSGRWHQTVDYRLAMGGSLIKKFLDGSVLHPLASPNGDGDEKVALLQEVAGVAAMGLGTRFAKFVLLYGPSAGNGKSQFLDMLRGLLPPSAVCSVAPSKFGDEKYSATMQGRLLNAVDEIKGGWDGIEADDFKTAIDGGVITARRIYRDPVSFRATALNIAGANVLPSFKGGIDGGVRRRIIIVGFNRSIANPDRECPDLVEHIGTRIATEEADLLLSWAIEGACRIIRQGAYTSPKSGREIVEGWVLDSDPVAEWFYERCEVREGCRYKVQDVYQNFLDWCDDRKSVLRDTKLPRPKGFGDRIMGLNGAISHGRCATARLYVGLVIKDQNGAVI